MRSSSSPRRARPGFRPLLLERLEGRVVPSFVAPLAFDVAGVPRAVAVADVNGDGRPDLATANQFSNDVSVLLGNGDGAFQAQRPVSTGNNPSAVVAGDLNGDGRQDLAVANRDSRTVSVLLGNGDGSFQPARNLSVGNQPHSVAVGDLNGDGRLDFAVTSYLADGSGSVSTLLGNGDGSFRSGGGGSTGRRPVFVTVGDFNGDGRLDLATANVDGNNVSVLLGNGDGAFQAARHFSAGSRPRSVAVGDFNGDGRLDLAALNYGASFVGSVSVLLGNGDGAFQGARDLPAGRLPYSLAVADFDGDGDLDFAVANFSRDSVGVFLGNGDGTFQNVRHFSGNRTYSVAVGDLNGDGLPDLATANFSNTVSVLLGNGDGSFQSAPTHPAAADPRSVATGDLNGDGFPDFVAANWGDEFHAGSGVSVHLGNGDGSFQAARLVPAGVRPAAVAVGDVNGDGTLDLAVANYGGDNTSLLLGNGDGTFQAARPLPAGSRPASIAVADLNADGLLDLVVANSGNPGVGDLGSVTVLLGNGDGTFQDPRNLFSREPVSVVVGDFNGDGRLDLVTVGSSFLIVLLGNGDGTFQAPRAVPGGGLSVAAGDFNGDGRLDLATASYNIALGTGTAAVRLGTGDGSFQEPRSYNAGGAARAVAVADFNGDGREDLAVGGGTVRVFLGHGDGAFQATHVSYVAESIPGALAAADFDGDGTPDLAVANSSSRSTLSSDDVAVLLNDGYWGGPAVSFYLDPDSGTVPVGAAFDLYVSPWSAAFEVVRNYTGRVVFWSTDPLATLPDLYRFRREDRGVASFPGGLTFRTPGVQELYVFDTATYAVIGYAAFNVLGAGPGGALGGGTPAAPDLFAAEELTRVAGSPVRRQAAPEAVPSAGPRQAAAAVPSDRQGPPTRTAGTSPTARLGGAARQAVLDQLFAKLDEHRLAG